jgi:hypothetical protein
LSSLSKGIRASTDFLNRSLMGVRSVWTPLALPIAY